MPLADRVAVGNTPTSLFQNTAEFEVWYVVVKNVDATNAFDVGDTGVAANAGFPVPAGASVQFFIGPGESIHAIADAGAPHAAVWASLWQQAQPA